MPEVLHSPQQASTKQMFPSMTLAFWQLRQTWGLLLISGLGIVVALTFVCTVTLYSRVAMSVDLQKTLASSSQNVDIDVQSFSEYPNSSYYAQLTQTLNDEFQQQLGSYLQQPQFVVDVSGLLVPGYGKMNLLGFPVEQVGMHLRLVQGRLPQTQSQNLEIALTQETASNLHVHLGSVISSFLSFGTGSLAVNIPFKMHVVGIVNIASSQDAFWHGNNFLSATGLDGTTYTGLVSNQTLLAVINQLGNNPTSRGQLLYAPFVLHWYYQLNPAHITINNLNTLLKKTHIVETYVNSNGFLLERTPFVEQIAVLYNESLQQYADRIAIVQLSLFSLVILMMSLVLFFVSMVAELLVERQSEVLALLNSRGASFSQILGLLLAQSTVLTAVALLLGPLLAFAIVFLLVSNTLRLPGSQAFALILSNGRQSSAILVSYVLLTAFVVVFSLSISMYRIARTTLISYRRETSRSTHRPLWQRFYLDILAGIVALTGYLVVWYIQHSAALDIHLSLLLVAPITLFACVFLLIAALLLLMRVLPFFVSLGERRARHSRSIAPLLALAQLARTPHQFLRMTLLLTVAIAFVLFSLIFSASQQQRIRDVAAFQVGADFSGTPISSTLPASATVSETAFFQHIPGVLSTTVGYTGMATGTYHQTVTVQVCAVDAQTFAQTAIWPGQNTPSSLTSLMTQLIYRRASAIASHVLPAIIDTSTATALHISPGERFTLIFGSDGPLQFLALAEVPTLPTVSEHGILVDYQSFATVYANTTEFTSGNTIPINFIWLRTKSDPGSLAHVRQTLAEMLASFADRRAIQANLQQEPLNLALLTVLTFGTAITLLFALLGTLLNSWTSIRSRVRSFVVLRALGATPRQFMSVLVCEQSLVYILSLLLGSTFGLLLSMQAVPRLLFTTVLPDVNINTLSSDDFYVLQNTPPIRLIIPPSVGPVLVTITIICTCTLGLMIAIITQSAISEVLRMNED